MIIEKPYKTAKVLETSIKDRKQFLKRQLSKPYVVEADSWKKEYFHNAAIYLNTNYRVRGGEICDFCRKQGMKEPSSPNVWPAMLQSLVKLGWIEKNAAVAHMTKHQRRNACQWTSRIYQS